ncbi:MAG: proline racemase family protein [Bacteroidetes bacterium]|nr:proline racemase family protein [Bacteroidota bacterium]MCY4233729.1 proline racemase family protein [Bacteroidota bacterium]
MSLDLESSQYWKPDEHRIQCIDAHTEGEPLRMIFSGYPKPTGNTLLEQRNHLQKFHDSLRTALMWEPRGHTDMYGCLITKPVNHESDFGVLFMHNEGYSTMCGHGIIAVTKVLLETGCLPKSEPETRVTIDTPAGQTTAWAKVENGQVESVRFRNVPSYVHALNQCVTVPTLGRIHYDLAFGGAYYAYVNIRDLGLEATSSHYSEIVRLGIMIKESIANSTSIVHPEEPDLGFLYGVIFIDSAHSANAHSRHVCVFADGEVDRSPTGTGVSARLALLVAKREIRLEQPIRIESIIGTSFVGQATQEISYGEYKAIIPEVKGRAFITGQHTFYIDPDDPLKYGFRLR